MYVCMYAHIQTNILM